MGRREHPLVLVVEDEPLVRMVAAVGLEDEGFEVIEAESAAGALEILGSRDDVGVLFTDVNMPGEIDGVELARLVHLRWPALSIVITSGREFVGREAMPDEGLFVAKPYRTDDLARAIQQLVA